MLFDQKLSLGSLIRIFWRQIAITWGLTLLETALLAALPLLIGFSIDGLLNGDSTPFFWLISSMGVLLVLAIGRRVYDTRAYGSMRVELGDALVQRRKGESVSAINARLEMGRELVDFLEQEAPSVMSATVLVVMAIAVLYSFSEIFAASAVSATIAVLLIYGTAGNRFFNLNCDLNQQVEKQVGVLQDGAKAAIRSHLLSLRRHEVRLSDTEAMVYGLIFAVLLSMLSFNLWYAAAQTTASSGQIFSIVTYSYEFLESAVVLPAALQSLTRLSEITQRINI